MKLVARDEKDQSMIKRKLLTERSWKRDKKKVKERRAETRLLGINGEDTQKVKKTTELNLNAGGRRIKKKDC